MKVLVTRAEPAASRTAARISELGHQPIKLPLFEIVETGNEIPEGGFDGLIFTSQKALEFLESQGWEPEAFDVPVFCVGKKTAEAAGALGFTNVITGSGEASQLAELIKDFGLPNGANLLYPSAVDRAFDMEAALSLSKMTLKTIEVYQVKPVFPSKQVLKSCFDDLDPGIVLIYSVLSAEHLSNVLKSYPNLLQASNVVIIAISQKTANKSSEFDWHEVFIADTPDETAMFRILDKIG